MSDAHGSLRSARDETIDALCRHFADEHISMSELERRLERARAAKSRDELDALLGDLRAKVPVPARAEGGRGEAPARRPAPGPAPGRPAAAKAPQPVRTSSHAAFAILGGTRRAGRWAPPSSMVAVAIMGGVELDFRDAVLKGGVTEINCFAFWGGVEITVPPGVHVDTHGFAVMGSFEQKADLETDPPPDAPRIRVNGFAVMGGVDIRVREPGEPRSRGKKSLRRRRERPPEAGG